MKETLKVNDIFTIIFDEMSITVTGDDEVVKIHVGIDIKKPMPTLDEDVFQSKNIYKLIIKADIKEQLEIYSDSLKETHKTLGEAKKLIEFINLNERNFLRKVVPELRLEEINENSSD